MDLVSGSDNALAELIRNLQDSISRLKEYEQDDGFDVQEEVVQNLKSEIDSKFTECYSHLKRFRVRARQATDKVAAKKICSQRQREIDNMKKDFDEWHNKQLLYSQPKAMNSKLKSTLDAQTARLQEGKSELDDARRAIIDAQDSANKTQEELQAQREVIKGANKKVLETQDELQGAGRILNRLFRRNVAQRAMVMAMLVAGGLVILLTLIACVVTPPPVSSETTAAASTTTPTSMTTTLFRGVATTTQQ